MRCKVGQWVKIKQEYMECPGVAVGKVIVARNAAVTVAFTGWCGGSGTHHNEYTLPASQLEPAKLMKTSYWG